jgi:hypothetical protein
VNRLVRSLIVPAISPVRFLQLQVSCRDIPDGFDLPFSAALPTSMPISVNSAAIGLRYLALTGYLI